MRFKTEEALKLMRQTHIKRWGIVPMKREQSLAEHSFRVWCLALALYDTLIPIPHNSFERESVGTWALLHDAEEIWTGDLPSTFKRKLEEDFGKEVMKDLKMDVLQKHVPELAGQMRGIEGTFAACIVKIADAVEQVAYYRKFGYEQGAVLDYLYARAATAVKEAAQQFPQVILATEITVWVEGVVGAPSI